MPTGDHLGRVLGVAELSDLGELKRHLLLVEHIAVVQRIHRSSDWACRSSDPNLAADLDWLENRGIIAKVRGAWSFGTDSPIGKLLRGDPTATPVDGFVQLFHEALVDTDCREVCAGFRARFGVDAVLLHSPEEKLRGNLDEPCEMGDIHGIIIKSLPQPDDATPLESLLEFRNDPQSRSKLLALRRWAAKLRKMEASPIEVAQELEFLLHEYEVHMQLHKMKTSRGTFETVVTSTAEALEDLMKVRWGKLAKSLFAMSQRKIELTEAELKAPGREIAYVSWARHTFRARG